MDEEKKKEGEEKEEEDGKEKEKEKEEEEEKKREEEWRRVESDMNSIYFQSDPLDKIVLVTRLVTCADTYLENTCGYFKTRR